MQSTVAGPDGKIFSILENVPVKCDGIEAEGIINNHVIQYNVVHQ